MEIQFLEEGDRLTVRPTGRMEAANAQGFASSVEQRLASGTKSVTVDLEALESVDLSSIRSILRLARSLKAVGRSLDFVRGGAGVRHALEQAGMHEFFPFTPAIHSHRGHQDETP